MGRKRKPDKLSQDAAAAKAANMSYGQWMAMQNTPVIVENKIPDGWIVCKNCGKPFKPNLKSVQKYCDVGCQRQSHYEHNRERKREYMREYRAKQQERSIENGQSENAGNE